MAIHRNIWLAGTAAAVAALGASPALAAEDTWENPGLTIYAGPVIGYETLATSLAGNEVTAGGRTYGGLIGVDSRMGERGRIGLEAEVTGSGLSKVAGVSGPIAGTISTSAGRNIYVGAKLGYMIMPRLEVFVKGGYVDQKLDATFVPTVPVVPPATDPSVTVHENIGGWRVGGGTEIFVSKIRVRLEYDYSNYSPNSTNKVRTQGHTVQAGVLYGF